MPFSSLRRAAGIPCGAPCRAAILFCASLLAVFGGAAPTTRGASSPALDRLISQLPRPESWTKSPLQSALKDPDPILRDPAFRRMAASLSNKDNRHALESARALAAKYPKTPGIHLLRGRLAMSQGLYPEAEAAFHQTLALAPDASIAWQGLAMSQAEQKNLGSAVASARQAVKTGPKGPGNWLTLSLMELRVGHPREALEATRRTTALLPGSPLGWALQGVILANQRQLPQAVQSYRRAVALAPGNIDLVEAEAFCLLANNQAAEAVPLLQRASERSSGAYKLATLLGVCHLKAGNPAMGSAACRRALSAKSDFAPAWKVLGQCCAQQGKRAEAVDAYRKAVRFAPNDPEAKAQLAAITPLVRR